MVDITFKSYTLRKAIARATVRVSTPETIALVEQRKVPKGDIFEFARASALLAIKKTSDVIPDCHPLPVEYAQVRYEISGLSIHIDVEVHTIYKTGVEVEAMHGASVASLVIYDMLKPVDKGVEIHRIHLVEKKGGKSDLRVPDPGRLKAAVMVCSDTVSSGKKEDKSGKKLMELLEKQGFKTVAYHIVADEKAAIENQLVECRENGTDLLLITGGTGLSERDVTPEAVTSYLTRPVPGIMETVRQYGQQRVKTAMLSRGVAGFADRMLVITLPGSTGGVTDGFAALFPQVLHVFDVRENHRHD